MFRVHDRDRVTAPVPVAGRADGRRRWRSRLLLGAAAARAAATTTPRHRPSTSAQLEKQLETARARLDDAARDVADLTRKLYGDQEHDVMRFIGGPARGAMLGVNIGVGQTRDDGVEHRGREPRRARRKRRVCKTATCIVAIDGKSLTRSGDATRRRSSSSTCAATEPGQAVKVDYLRDGKRQSASVTTGQGRAADGRACCASATGCRSPRRRACLGAVCGAAVRRILRRGSRVRLARARQRSRQSSGSISAPTRGCSSCAHRPAGSTELEEGDVLLSIDGRTPENPGHAFRILRLVPARGEGQAATCCAIASASTSTSHVPADDADGRGARTPVRVPLPPRAAVPPPVPPSPSRTRHSS